MRHPIKRACLHILSRAAVGFAFLSVFVVFGWIVIGIESTAAASFPETIESGITIAQGGADESASDIFTQERLMLLGTFLLVVLTWFYLKWRPAHNPDEPVDESPPRDRE